jgi:SAM-dependent methyltransferase
MGRRYPRAQVIGVDLAPNTQPETELPANVRFITYDINRGLEHLSSNFDIVHSRSIMGGIHDAKKTLMQAQLCAKPGGIAIFIEGDPDICAEDKLHTIKFPNTTPGGTDNGGSWFRMIAWGESTTIPRKFEGIMPERIYTYLRSHASQQVCWC